VNDRSAEIEAIEDDLLLAYSTPAPIEAPDSYPGPVPDWSYRLNNEGITYLQDYQVAKWIAGRTPVLAVGSNASPAQLRHKFESEPDLLASLPVTRAIVAGLAAAYTPYRAGYGSIPTTPHLGDDLRSLLSILWLSDDQLAHLNETERGGYQVGLIGLPEGVVATVDGVGDIADDLLVYASVRGALLIDGAPAVCSTFVTYQGEDRLPSFDQTEIAELLRSATPSWPESGPIDDLGPPFTVARPLVLREERQP
jgi:hypothetical protein